MATRAGLLRRYFSTSIFSSQTAAAASAAANPKPAPFRSTTLYVSGLTMRTTSEKLHEEAAKFGEVVHARVVIDRSSRVSKVYGFVKYATIAQAEQGIKGLDAKFLDGWTIFAEFARPRTPQCSASQANYTQRDEMD